MNIHNLKSEDNRKNIKNIDEIESSKYTKYKNSLQCRALQNNHII